MGRKLRKSRNPLVVAGVRAASQIVAKQGPKLLKQIKARRAAKKAAGTLPRQKMRKFLLGDDSVSSAGVASISSAPGTGSDFISPAVNMIPTAVTSSLKQGKWKGGNYGPIIRKREFLGSIAGSVAFSKVAVTSASSGNVELNPGVETTFAWLSAFAMLFESYKFKYLRLCYVPTTNLSATGSIWMVPIIDAAESAPSASRELISQYSNTIDSNTKLSACCYFPLGNLTEPFKWRYVRYPGGTQNPINLTDVGYFAVYIGGCADTSIQGELWLDYEVELFNPRFRPAISRVEGGRIDSGGTVSAANPCGTVPTTDVSAVGISVNATSVVTIDNVGTYLIVMFAAGTGTSWTITATGSTVATLTAITGHIFNGSNLVTVVAIDQTSNTGTYALVVGGGTCTASIVVLASAPSSSLSALPREVSKLLESNELKLEFLMDQVAKLTEKLKLSDAPRCLCK